MKKNKLKKKTVEITGLIILLVGIFSAGFLGTNYLLRKLNPITQNTPNITNNNISTNKLSKEDQQIKQQEEQQRQQKAKEEEQAKIKNQPLYPKEVFLTLDDGPSIYTSKIIKILNDNNVKASFFVIGKNVDKYPDLAKLEIQNGMCIMPHSYSHDYNIAYKSVDAYFDDLQRCIDSMTKATGENDFKYLRFPGGSDNQVSHGNMKSIRSEVIQKGYKYIDWNVSSADAAPYYVEAERIRQNVLSQCKEHNFAIVLMHDAPDKATTVEALPEIIQGLKEQGFVFRTFSDLSDQEIKKMIEIKVMNR